MITCPILNVLQDGMVGHKMKCWSHEEKGIQLALNHRGAAKQVLGCLTDFEVDYDVLCLVLKRRFSPKERLMSTEVNLETERSL